jgi:hypothetical protein
MKIHEKKTTDYPTLEVGKDIYVDNQGYVDMYQGILPNGYGFKPNRDYLRPITINELTLNPNLKQNPGWSCASFLPIRKIAGMFYWYIQ